MSTLLDYFVYVSLLIITYLCKLMIVDRTQGIYLIMYLLNLV